MFSSEKKKNLSKVNVFVGNDNSYDGRPLTKRKMDSRIWKIDNSIGCMKWRVKSDLNRSRRKREKQTEKEWASVEAWKVELRRVKVILNAIKSQALKCIKTHALQHNHSKRHFLSSVWLHKRLFRTVAFSVAPHTLKIT